MHPLFPDPLAVSAARGLARTVCAREHLAPERCEATVLVTSELIGNAVRHGSPPLSYDVALDGEDVLVVVEDCDQHPPADGQHCSPLDAEGGRGLFLVTALARRWGWTPTGRGKQIWARI